MGCAGSKSQQESGAGDVVVYRPPPTSVSLFDISAVEEPWLIAKKNKPAGDHDGDSEEEEEETTDDDTGSEEEEAEEEKAVQVPLPLLDKLVEGYELAPASWSEVSRALEDMKPHVLGAPAPAVAPPKKKKKKKTKKQQQQQQKQEQQQQKQEQQHQPQLDDASAAESKPAPPELAGRRVVKDNPFLMRDRETKHQAGPTTTSSWRWKRRDPFEGYPERRPPGATGGGVVLYTTTLHGVRRTFDDCERARDLVHACAEAAGVAAVDERDVSLHAGYLRELRDLLPAGEGSAPPRLFVMGRYVGGADECAALADSGKLGEMMRWAKARGEACAAKDGRGCEGCGGARFVPCWECGGSCKVVVDGAADVVERCAKCNENGLMMCPICH